ncbi:CLUMA_CG005701, isoform A [Clunio marinus]|uniref:Multiple inositol polyphosphate phosphatase 1 n=1 Tax=Clunio marinus TaxID=568069 RepID=A0A1J1HW25_9DIPT|nr:CLUMA_CG005701, isoform A [Clunio marinus]
MNGFEEVDFAVAPERDLLLVPYENCDLYNDVIRVFVEQLAFADGPEFQEMLTQVSAKLGFHGAQQLRSDEIETLMNICKYEMLWDVESPSAMCSAFSVGNHQVDEYHKDVDSYFRYGYGYTDYRTLFENLNCHLIQEMLRFLKSNLRTNHVARIFNGHLVSLKMILVTFGAFEDENPLTRHNFAQQAFRQWKASIISPMGANLGVIRYDCDGSDNDVLFLINETPLHIPGCQPNGLCKMSFLMERFGRFLNANCDEVFCRNSRE